LAGAPHQTALVGLREPTSKKREGRKNGREGQDRREGRGGDLLLRRGEGGEKGGKLLPVHST